MQCIKKTMLLETMLLAMSWLACQYAFAYDLPVRNSGAWRISGLRFTDNMGNTAAIDLPRDTDMHYLRMGGDAAPVPMLTFTISYCSQKLSKPICALPGYVKMSSTEWYAGCMVEVGLQTIHVNTKEQKKVRPALVTGMACPHGWETPD